MSFFTIEFRGTNSNQFTPIKIGAIDFRLLETDPESIVSSGGALYTAKSDLDCLMCVVFARHRHADAPKDRTGELWE